MREQLLKDAKSKMEKTLSVTRDELSKLRSGRAAPALLDAVRVNYYGAATPLKQLASVTSPEPRLLVVQPYDASVAAEIQKAIQAADLGLQPQLDGKTIRIPIPTLSRERREELVKVVKKVVEDGRVSVRSIRRDANEHAKKLKTDKKITEDELSLSLEEVQKATDQCIRQLDEMASGKEKELTTV